MREQPWTIITAAATFSIGALLLYYISSYNDDVKRWLSYLLDDLQPRTFWLCVVMIWDFLQTVLPLTWIPLAVVVVTGVGFDRRWAWRLGIMTGIVSMALLFEQWVLTLSITAACKQVLQANPDADSDIHIYSDFIFYPGWMQTILWACIIGWALIVLVMWGTYQVRLRTVWRAAKAECV